ncbi:MAG: response regulator [Proteobacteria bacterium]|nr:response regulator [Pseudomonadota bacterium]MBI3498545.1 response regulator [Pseudomonadota bacterium]
MDLADVLLIADDPDLRETLRAILVDAGHKVVCAEGRQAGIDAFRRKRPDLVMIDIAMPEAEVVQSMRALRANDPSVPMLAIAGGGRPLDRASHLRMAKQLGATSIRSTRFRGGELSRLVGRVQGRGCADGEH